MHFTYKSDLNFFCFHLAVDLKVLETKKKDRSQKSEEKKYFSV